jgi:hypothetical protein
MNTSNPDEKQHGLGPAKKAPVVEVEDEYERYKSEHGDWIWRNKRTKAISTNKPEKPIDWKAIQEAMDKIARQQEEDGYPNIYWGSM